MSVLPTMKSPMIFELRLSHDFTGFAAQVDWHSGKGSTNSIDSAVLAVENFGAVVEGQAQNAEIAAYIASRDAEKAASDARRVELERVHQMNAAKAHAKANGLPWAGSE